jgi:hypothetical protein
VSCRAVSCRVVPRRHTGTRRDDDDDDDDDET